MLSKLVFKRLLPLELLTARPTVTWLDIKSLALATLDHVTPSAL